LKQKVRTLELEPGSGGCFEVFVDGRRIYSKLETGEFPDPDGILEQVKGRAA
jgi:selenoprotein W-related protein